ncbi:MAG: hypothetical protein JWO75_5761 [Actinomycetia bacterium]|nr:hypothetical protein [Actinomycetes bacterium]
MNTDRGAASQFGLEARARAAVLATADEIRAEDVPPAPAWRPDDSPARVTGREQFAALVAIAKAGFAKAARLARG